MKTNLFPEQPENPSGTQYQATPAAGEEARPPAPTTPRQPAPLPKEAERALSVTRPKPITGTSVPGGFPQWTNLACGIDTLDVGLGVHWGPDWPELSLNLECSKVDAAGTQGKPWRIQAGEPLLILPSGKGANYRFHLQASWGHIYLAKAAAPNGLTPNVYVSFTAAGLWLRGLGPCVQLLGRSIRELGGKIKWIRISRVDLAADFEVCEAPSLDFLRAHLVTEARKQKHFENAGQLETFYVGGSENPIQLRIYDKTAEIKTSHKEWFREIWKCSPDAKVWRVEFQLRRTVMRFFRIDSIGSLRFKMAGFWSKLTDECASLRLLDSSNITRRSIHPIWVAVQACAPKFGPMNPVGPKVESAAPPEARWYENHIAGCLKTYAALRGHDTLEDGLEDLREAIERRKSSSEYADEIRIKKIKLGTLGFPVHGPCPPSWGIAEGPDHE